MLLVLPQNAAILLVWLRNLQAGWYAPFPSDHNVLAVLGYVGLVELAQTGWTCQAGKVGERDLSAWTGWLLYSLSAIVLLLSARYAFVAGVVANIAFCWLYAIQHV